MQIRYDVGYKIAYNKYNSSIIGGIHSLFLF